MKKTMKNRMGIALLMCMSLMLFIALPAAAESDIAPIGPAIDDQAAALADIENNRDSVVSEIIELIRGTAEERGYHPSWEGEMTEALQNAEADKLLAALDAASYDQVVAALFGNNPETIGSWTEDLVFTPVDPCRIVDTRDAGGEIAAGTSRSFFTRGNTVGQGGTTCNDPNFDPSAAVLNITAVDPSAHGNLRVYPYGSSVPNASIVNYEAGINIANSTVAKTTRGVGYDFTIWTYRTTHVVVDLMGYFAPPERTQPDFTSLYSTASIANNAYAYFYSPYCPSGYTWVSAGTLVAGGTSLAVYVTRSGRLSTLQRSYCGYRNLSGAARTVYCLAYCLRIPGR